MTESDYSLEDEMTEVQAFKASDGNLWMGNEIGHIKTDAWLQDVKKYR